MFRHLWQSRFPKSLHRAGGPRRSPARRWQVELLEARVVPSTLRTITYDQITSQPGSAEINGTAPYNVLSSNGNKAVFSAGFPGQVYTINADGSGQTLVDSNGSNVLDLSADGSVVLEVVGHGDQGTELRVVNADGSNPHTAFQSSGSAVPATRLSADGQTIFFEDIASPSGDAQNFPPGLYAVAAAANSTPQLLVSDAQVAALLGSPAGMGIAGSIYVDASADGQHLVFAANPGGFGGDYVLLGVNRDGSDLHEIGPLSPNLLEAAGISADGNKVFRYDAGSAGPQVTVFDFDGSNPVVLSNLPDDFALANGVEHIQLSQDGSKLLLPSAGLLVNTDNSGMVQIGTHVGLDSVGYGLVHPGLYHATMNGAANTFLYTFFDATGLFQLAVAHLDPASLGGDPALSNISINPSYLVTNAQSTITVSAAVSASNTPAGVSEAFLLGEVQESGHLTDQQLSRQSDGTYANNNIYYGYDGPAGPRTVRVSAETVDGNGLQHVTSVEVSGLSVVTQAPTPPTSSVAALPAYTASTSIPVSWSGSDGSGPGIAYYDVYVSDNGAAFTLFQHHTTATSATFTGQDGHSYGFYSIATDQIGAVGPTPSSAQAVTLIDVTRPRAASGPCRPSPPPRSSR
jgi:hypothetical protein